jgi:hypothetical protein
MNIQATLVLSAFASRSLSSQKSNNVAAFFLTPVYFAQHSSCTECPNSLLRNIFNSVSTLQQENYSSNPRLKWMSQSLLFSFLLTGNKSDRKIAKDKNKFISLAKNYFNHRVQNVCETAA